MIRNARRFAEKIYGSILEMRDNYSAKQCEASVGDIILQRAELEHCQFLLTARKMDIEAYCSGEDKTFPYQNTVSRAIYGIDHEEELGNRQFAELIQSYKDNGYNPSSYLTVDNDCRLIDGNHRMGMNLYMGIERFNIRILKRESVNKKNLDRYFELGLSTSFIKRVFDESQRIQEWLINTGNTFCCLIQGEVAKDNISLVSDIEMMTTVLKKEVKAKSKVESVLIQFSLIEPKYEIRDNKLESQRVFEIERLLKKRAAKYSLNTLIRVSKSCLEGKEIWKEFYALQ